jgi:hypothetical protein
LFLLFSKLNSFVYDLIFATLDEWQTNSEFFISLFSFWSRKLNCELKLYWTLIVSIPLNLIEFLHNIHFDQGVKIWFYGFLLRRLEYNFGTKKYIIYGAMTFNATTQIIDLVSVSNLVYTWFSLFLQVGGHSLYKFRL